MSEVLEIHTIAGFVPGGPSSVPMGEKAEMWEHTPCSKDLLGHSREKVPLSGVHLEGVALPLKGQKRWGGGTIEQLC